MWDLVNINLKSSLVTHIVSTNRKGSPSSHTPMRMKGTLHGINVS